MNMENSVTRELRQGELIKEGDITVMLDRNGNFEKYVPIIKDAIPVLEKAPYLKGRGFATILRAI